MTKSVKPNLILLLGPAGCGKTQRLSDSFAETLQTAKDPLKDDLLFILPTSEHRARILDLILRRGLAGFFQKRITTFDRALKEFLKLGGIQFATDVMRRMILKEVLANLKLHYFDSAQGAAGFLNLIAQTIVEFKEYLIRPEDLQNKLTLLKKEFPEFSLKYDDLCLIYEAYEKELKERRLTDQRDCLRVLEEGLKRGEFHSPQLTHVWIDGFSDFSKIQLSFIEFLTRHADQITITLTLDQNPLRGALFEPVLKTQAALEDLGFKSEWMESRNYRAQNHELKFLERNLFCSSIVVPGQQLLLDPPIVVPAQELGVALFPIQIFEATGLAGEMEMIAREIKKQMRLGNCHFSDVAVLFRNTDPYVHVIESVFRKFGIPFEIHERFRLSRTPLARTLLSFLGIFLNGWLREDVFNFLKSSYVKIADYESVSELEIKALERAVFKDRSVWLAAFPNCEALKRLAQYEDQFLKLSTTVQFSAWLKHVMQTIGFFEFPSSSDRRVRVDRESMKRILLLLDELSALALPSGTATAEQFIHLIQIDLFSIHSRDKNKVQIYNVSVARQKEYKIVFLAGLLEKQFPIQVKEDPILFDSERRFLNRSGEMLKEFLPRQQFERYFFYLAATRARERLFLTYPRFNLEGRESLPSFYTDEVQHIFSGRVPVKEQPITEVLPSWQEAASQEEAEALVIRDLWHRPAGGRKQEDHHLAFAVYNQLIENPAFKRFLPRLLKPILGQITDERILPYFKVETWSPTPLEMYAECPYRYFGERVLQLETKTEGIDIKRRGIILHDVLEHFFTYQRDSGKKMSFEEAAQYCFKKFDELWHQEPLGGDRFYKIELERRNMKEMILGILKLELTEEAPPIRGLEPAYFEFEFKDLVLKGKTGDLKLRGKIDRIDTDHEGKYALIIDYKYGKTFDSDALAYGTSLQLPLYLLAVRETLGLKPLGGHLYSLVKASSSGFHHKEHLTEAGVSTKKGISFGSAEFEEVIERAVRFAETFAHGVEKAEIPIRPRDCVSYCGFSSLCRIEKWRLEHIYRETR